MLLCRNMFEVDSNMRLSYLMATAYTMGHLVMDDMPTSVACRDVTNVMSPENCIHFVRFTHRRYVALYWWVHRTLFFCFSPPTPTGESVR